MHSLHNICHMQIIYEIKCNKSNKEQLLNCFTDKGEGNARFYLHA